MSYTSLLLHLDDDPRATVRLDCALHLARRFSSRLTGVSCHRPAPAAAANVGLGPDSLTLELTQARQFAQAREQDFEARCRSAELAAFDLATADEEPGRALVRLGRCSDLVIVGQVDPSDPQRASRRAAVDEVVLNGARPTLLLPYAGRFDSLGDNILIAWDDSHEAARAVADAMPMLERARSVRVVEFDRSAGGNGRLEASRLVRVLGWLRSHDVKASGSVQFTNQDIGNALLSYAADVGADLIVMGAWGQSRLTERLLGGCTRTVFESMTVPVLTSH